MSKSTAEKWVTIATFNFAHEAHLARTRLESQGIPANIADEHIVSINWFYAPAVGGIKLNVLETDVQKAKEVFAEGSKIDPPKALQCPKCNSMDIEYQGFWRKTLFLSWILIMAPFLPFLFRKKKWKCKACNFEWRK